MRRSARRVIAGIVLGMFCVSSNGMSPAYTAMGVAQTVCNPRAVYTEFMLNPEVGAVVERFNGTSDRTVVCIQDLHCNPDAQRAIAAIIGTVKNTYGNALRYVSVEGSWGLLDTSFFASIPKGYGVKESLVDSLVNKGALSGAEYFSIMHPNSVVVHGVEQPRLYRENFDVFMRAVKQRDAARNAVNAVEKFFRRAEENHTSKTRQEIHTLIEQYRTGSIAHDMYCAALVTYAQRLGISLTSYPQITRVVNAGAMKAMLPPLTSIHAEAALCARQVFSSLSHHEKKQLTVFATAKDSRYYEYLARVLRHTRIAYAARYPLFSKYCAYLATLRSMDAVRVLDEEEALTCALEYAAAATPQEKECVVVLRQCRLLNRMIDGTISLQQERVFREGEGKFFAAIEHYNETRKHVSVIRNAAQTLGTFYDIAERRNECIVGDTLSDSSRVSIVVAGGFHAQGITRALRARGISYCMIMPRIAHRGDDTVYMRRLNAQRAVFHPTNEPHNNTAQSMNVISMFQAFASDPQTSAAQRAILQGALGADADSAVASFGIHGVRRLEDAHDPMTLGLVWMGLLKNRMASAAFTEAEVQQFFEEMAGVLHHSGGPYRIRIAGKFIVFGNGSEQYTAECAEFESRDGIVARLRQRIDLLSDEEGFQKSVKETMMQKIAQRGTSRENFLRLYRALKVDEYLLEPVAAELRGRRSPRGVSPVGAAAVVATSVVRALDFGHGDMQLPTEQVQRGEDSREARGPLRISFSMENLPTGAAPPGPRRSGLALFDRAQRLQGEMDEIEQAKYRVQELQEDECSRDFGCYSTQYRALLAELQRLPEHERFSAVHVMDVRTSAGEEATTPYMWLDDAANELFITPLAIEMLVLQRLRLTDDARWHTLLSQIRPHLLIHRLVHAYKVDARVQDRSRKALEDYYGESRVGEIVDGIERGRIPEPSEYAKFLSKIPHLLPFARARAQRARIRGVAEVSFDHVLSPGQQEALQLRIQAEQRRPGAGNFKDTYFLSDLHGAGAKAQLMVFDILGLNDMPDVREFRELLGQGEAIETDSVHDELRDKGSWLFDEADEGRIPQDLKDVLGGLPASSEARDVSRLNALLKEKALLAVEAVTSACTTGSTAGAIRKELAETKNSVVAEVLSRRLLDALYGTEELRTPFRVRLNFQRLLKARMEQIEGRSIQDWEFAAKLHRYYGHIQIIFMGDIGDRGPHGIWVYELLQELDDLGLLHVSITGNHDLWMALNLKGYHLPFYERYRLYERRISRIRLAQHFSDAQQRFLFERRILVDDRYNKDMVYLKIRDREQLAVLFGDADFGMTADAFLGWFEFDMFNDGVLGATGLGQRVRDEVARLGGADPEGKKQWWSERLDAFNAEQDRFQKDYTTIAKRVGALYDMHVKEPKF